MKSKITTEHSKSVFITIIVIMVLILVQSAMICSAGSSDSDTTIVKSEAIEDDLDKLENKLNDDSVDVAYTVGTDYGIDDEVSNNAIVSDYGVCDLDDVGIRYKYIDGVLMKYVGKFSTTHYCSCASCCGPGASGRTASGRMAEAGVSIAVDKNVIPLGKKVYLSGYGMRRADDTGGAIKRNKIDVFVSSHSEALSLGVRKNVDVWVEV